MMMRLWVVLLALIAASPARPAEEPAPRVLKLHEALSMALEQNRDIERAQAYAEWVQGAYLEARSVAMPQFSLSASAARMSDESLLDLYGDFAEVFPTTQNLYSGEVRVSQPIYTFGKVGAALRAARIGFKTADEQLRVAQQAALRSVTIAFYDVLLAKELANIAGENLVMKERHLEEARRKYDLGTATDFDVLAAEVAVQNARPLAISTQNGIRTARERLRFLLAEPDPVDAAGLLEAESEELPDYAEAFATAVERRPDLKDLEYRAGVQKELINIASATNKPQIDFEGSLGYRYYDLSDIDSSGKLWSAGVFVSFPFFDGWRTKGLTQQAASDYSQVRVETERLRDSISLDIHTAIDAVREAEEIVKGLGGTVQQAERLLFMAERGFEYGVKTRLDVEDAQLAVLQARGNLARAARDDLVARTQLEWVMGTLGE